MESRLNPQPPYYLGLETGGTKLVASLLDDALQGLATKEIARPAKATASETLALLAELAQTVQRETGVRGAALAAAGWGFGGYVDRSRNRPARNLHEVGWEEIPATETLAVALSVPVFVENDCKVAGLAEAQIGAGSPRGLTAYVTLGSGVGSGLIWNGRILASGPCGEGEIGHMCVVKNGARCACGRRGCLEAYCSGWGVGERAVEAVAAAAHQRTPLMERLLAAEPRQRAAILFNAWPDDPFARGQGELFLGHLADACGALCLLVAPSHLVLGGGLSQQPWLAGALAPLIDERLPAVMRGHTQVRAARLGARSVSYGAALYARVQSAVANASQGAMRPIRN